MASPDPRPPVVVVTGPTATGKTPLAIALAQRFGGEIVNADSMQVYRYMDIGTAKPTPEQRAQVPHHLLDVVTPDVPYSAGRYAEAAHRAAAAIRSRGRVVILAGGTGLYIRAFLEGLIPTGPPDAALRAELEAEQAAAEAAGDPLHLYRRLQEQDPEAAARIHPNDVRRITRALEIARAGSPASRIRAAHGFGDRPYRVLQLALDLGRAALDARIDARCKAMLDAGLLREMRDLAERGYGPELRSMQSIGYRHMVPVLLGADILPNALAAMQRDTRRFARRQRTWLRGVREKVCVDPRSQEAIFARVEAFLAG
jgi:tRNA dimethylallyltransferase